MGVFNSMDFICPFHFFLEVAQHCLPLCLHQDGLCHGWYQSYADDFDWRRHSGATWPYSTGPSSGHGGYGFYMYMDASFGGYGDKAKLLFSPPSSVIGTISCLKFYYHMYGATINRLSVLHGNSVVFTKSGQQGYRWLYAEVTLLVQNTITFEGIVGSSESGDIAIDDVSLMDGACAVSCNFDYGLCSGWSQSNADVFNWSRGTGNTPSTDTGPSSEQSSELGYYMYIEASSPRREGDNAKLVLSLPGNGELGCLSFYYHMYGENMGTLNVFIGNMKVFTQSGDHGNT
ncbi:MAM and LDL-receptor class A domain-containing protein 1-like isoform X2 [Acropora palmata]|uniref:MAM and LDL-receptor class A domain-containing protein 1-like isoform X2 n=1 Tax=Acropora palmata TaxID=6131 RepID=UPI003DA040DA